MPLRFVVVEDAADPHHDRSFLLRERTDPPALRTRLLLAQWTGLLLCRHLQGARQQCLDGCHGDLFHLRQIDIKAGSFLAPLLPHDDFSPAVRQFLDVTEIL
jgi:hypothetical protein